MQSEPWIIRTWQPCLDDSRALNEVLLAAKPRLSRMSPEAELSRTSRLIEGIEEGALLAFEGEKPVGAVILSILRSPEVAILMGGVKPGVCGRGWAVGSWRWLNRRPASDLVPSFVLAGFNQIRGQFHLYTRLDLRVRT